MTDREHQLMMEMFKQQAIYYAGLVELLKSRGLLDSGDLPAFDALVSASSRSAVAEESERYYRDIAEVLGVIGVPPPLEPPS